MNNCFEHLAIMITENCNLNCYHCFRYTGHNVNIDLGFLEKLAKKIEHSSIDSIHFTGGEPFLASNILEIMKIFSKYGKKISIATNGTLLNTEKIKLFKENGLNKIIISMHSENSEFYDKLTGSKGLFYKVIQNIKKCLDIGLLTHINLPISIHNVNSAIQTLYFLDGLGVDRIKILYISPIGKGIDIQPILFNEWDNLAKTIENTKFNKSEIKIQYSDSSSQNETKCTIYPFKYLNLSPNGSVYPCCLLNNRVGMEIGHISELLNGDFMQKINLFNDRILEKFSMYKNTIPCLDLHTQKNELYKGCPLYSKKVS